VGGSEKPDTPIWRVFNNIYFFDTLNNCNYLFLKKKFMSNRLPAPLTGIIPPMITPLKDQDTLDHEGLERLIEHILEGGVHGLFILGTSGEGPGLSYQIRNELVNRVCEQVRGRVPVLVGITDTSVAESLKLAEIADQSNADAVVAAPPYYFRSSQKELTAYFGYLADHSPLPLFLYNMPSHTKVRIDSSTVLSLSEHDNITGLKDSSADLIYFQTVVAALRNKPGFRLLVGPEQLLIQTVMAGGHGGVNGGANMFPQLYVELFKAAENRNFERMNRLQDRVLQIASHIYSFDSSGNGVIKGIKSVLSLMGICSDAVTQPLQALSPKDKDKLENLLKKLDPADIL
jgi:4-hydroxy-tetrahydrodipicolinate synthase